jgi:hypothetical protein
MSFRKATLLLLTTMVAVADWSPAWKAHPLFHRLPGAGCAANR